MSKREKSVNTLESPVTEVAAEFPERHVLIKCPGCRRVIDQTKMAENLDVCPRCGRHLRVSGRKRMRITVDAGSFEEWDRELAATDFLEFPGYAEKLEAAREKSHENDGVVCGRGKVGGHDCALFFMNAEFMMGSMGSVVGEKIARTFERATELGLPWASPSPAAPACRRAPPRSCRWPRSPRRCAATARPGFST